MKAHEFRFSWSAEQRLIAALRHAVDSVTHSFISNVSPMLKNIPIYQESCTPWPALSDRGYYRDG
jgi:hypothetical protein